MEQLWETQLRCHILPAVAPFKSRSMGHGRTDCVGEAELSLMRDPRFTTRRTFEYDGKPYELEGVVLAPISRERPFALVDRLVKAVTKAAADGDPHLQQIPAELSSHETILPEPYDTANSATAIVYGAARRIAEPLLKSRLFTGPNSEPVHLYAHNEVDNLHVDAPMHRRYEEVDMSIAASGRGTEHTVLSVATAKSPRDMNDYVFDLLDDYARSRRKVFAHVTYCDEVKAHQIEFKFDPSPEDDKTLTYDERRNISDALAYAFRAILKCAAVALCTDTRLATMTNWSRYASVTVNDEDYSFQQKVYWSISTGRRQDGTLVPGRSDQARGVWDGTPSPVVLLLAAAFDKFRRLGRRVAKEVPEYTYRDPPPWTSPLDLTEADLLAAGVKRPRRLHRTQSPPAAPSIVISAATPAIKSTEAGDPSIATVAKTASISQKPVLEPETDETSQPAPCGSSSESGSPSAPKKKKSV